MKTKSLLFSLVSLSLSFTALSVHAANTTDEKEPVRLPAYIIKADRQTAAEKRVEQSLQELRAVATKPLVLECNAPLLPARHSDKQMEAKSPTLVVAGV